MGAPTGPEQPPYGTPQPPQPPPGYGVTGGPAQPPAQPPPAQPPAPPAAGPPQAAPGQTVLAEGWAIKRGIVRVVLLSFGVTYIFYWFHKTRPKVTAELGTYDNVTAQTWGLIVPVLNYFILYWLLRDIAEARRRLGLRADPESAIMLVIWIFVAPVGIALSQQQLNEYWDYRSGGYATDDPLTFIEVLAAYAFWIVYFAIIIVVIVIAVAANH
jgi:hypothetical protein